MISDRRDNLFIEVGSGGRLWAPLKDPMTQHTHRVHKITTWQVFWYKDDRNNKQFFKLAMAI